MAKFALLAFILISAHDSAWAASFHYSNQVTRREGEAYLLSYGSPQPTGPAPHFAYQGLYYSNQKVKPGDSLAFGSLLRTGKESRVRMVYRYGDVLELGPDSFLAMKKFQKGPKVLPEPHLEKGVIRVGLRHQGVLSDMTLYCQQLSFHSAGAGYFVAVNEQGRVHLVVTHGEVEVEFEQGVRPSLRVASGQQLGIRPGGYPEKIQVLTRRELLAMQLATAMTEASAQKGVAGGKGAVAAWEQEAYEALLEDLSRLQPKIYESFQKDESRWRHLDSLLAFSIEKLVFRLPYGRNQEEPEPPDEWLPMNSLYVPEGS